jgi:adenosine deaminase
VTANTDDVISFDQGISDEFMNLYRTGVWTATKLDEIRKDGLAQAR